MRIAMEGADEGVRARFARAMREATGDVAAKISACKTSDSGIIE